MNKNQQKKKSLITVGAKNISGHIGLLPGRIERILLAILGKLEDWTGHLLAIVHNSCSVAWGYIIQSFQLVFGKVLVWKEDHQWSRDLFAKLGSSTSKIKIAYNDLMEAKRNLFGEDAVEIFSKVDKSVELWGYIRYAIKFSFRAIVTAFAIFVVWGGLAPLDSAIQAQGVIVSNSNNKVVQHREGGVISRIMVRDGQGVRKGEVLLMLEDSGARASVNITKEALEMLTAQMIRLNAEKEKIEELMSVETPFLLASMEPKDEDGVALPDISAMPTSFAPADAKELSFNDPILDINSPTTIKFLNTQRSLYQAKMQIIISGIQMKQQDVINSIKSIKASKAYLKSAKAASASLSKEAKNLETLEKKGYVSKHNLWEKQRSFQAHEADAQKSEQGVLVEIEKIISHKIAISSTISNALQTTYDEISRTQSQLAKTREDYQHSQYTLEHTEIKAPEDGVVTGLAYHTVGGVIGQGANVLEIVPADDKLVLEAHVKPHDISLLHVGMLSRIQLDAYKSKLVPRLDAKVVHISADIVHSMRSDMPPYYKVRIEIDENELKRVNYDVKLLPGMPATVFIIRGSRTMLQYMLSPIIDSFHRAFKEA